jgi:aspartate oxidase
VAGLVAGAIGADGRLAPGVIAARAVVIAAGGLGQAFGTTSNPAGATGDGIAIAARAGAVIRDLEFVQFHPTVLWLPGASGQCPLITEALRGAGAVLRDLDGTPLMAGHDPRGDLAPRDVVAARMAEVIAASEAGHVWLDATELGRDLLENGFPTVTAACRKHGIDPVTDRIPVAPGAHYSCGGIRADLDGRTSVPGLYAIGEAASTGVQGANRLASNSVTEAIIAGRRTGTVIAETLSGGAGPAQTEAPPAGACLLETEAPPASPQETQAPPAGASPQETQAPPAGASPQETQAPPAGSQPTQTGAGAHLLTNMASPAAATGQDRGSKEETVPGAAAERPFCPDSPSAFSGRCGDRGSSAANIAADDPRSRPGPAGRGELAAAMSRYAGVLRDADGLNELLRIIAGTGGSSGPATSDCGNRSPMSGALSQPSAWEPAMEACEGSRVRAEDVAGHTGRGSDGRDVEHGIVRDWLDLDRVEAANLRTVSLLIAAGALRRAESRGCHRRRDAAGSSPAPWHTLARWDGRELVLTEEAL